MRYSWNGCTTGTVVTGAALGRIGDEEFRSVVRNATVFARSSPEHKLRIIQALQANREVDVMTGDWVNDASSLKQTDVVAAMQLGLMLPMTPAQFCGST